MTLGFLGLGSWATRWPRNLLRAGIRWPYVQYGGQGEAPGRGRESRFCATPKQVAEAAEIIFLCVGDTAMSERVTLGPGRHSGRCARRLDRRRLLHRGAVLRPPGRRGSGREGRPLPGYACDRLQPGAEGGTLTIMVGGDAAIYEKLKPYLEPLGKLVYTVVV